MRHLGPGILQWSGPNYQEVTKPLSHLFMFKLHGAFCYDAPEKLKDSALFVHFYRFEPKF